MNYEKVLEWFGWTIKKGMTTGLVMPYTNYYRPDGSLYDHRTLGVPKLEDPYLQARYFDPYILEKGYEIKTAAYQDRAGEKHYSCEIMRFNPTLTYDVVCHAKTEALAKREAYIKVAENENRAV